MDCPICYTSITENSRFTILSCNCSTMYHTECINKWFLNEKSCPTCRKKWIPRKFNKRLDNTNTGQDNRIRRRRNAITPELARILTDRLFLESIGINSSIHSYNTGYTIDTEIEI